MTAGIAQIGFASAGQMPMAAGLRALRTTEGLGRRVNAGDPRTVEKAASQMLSELFFAPMLEEMRKFPLGRDVATGGFTEEAFGQQLDQRISDTVAASSPALVRVIADRVGKKGPAKPIHPSGPAQAAGLCVPPSASQAFWPAQLQVQTAVAGGSA
jgi:hypothetical protein